MTLPHWTFTAGLGSCCLMHGALWRWLPRCGILLVHGIVTRWRCTCCCCCCCCRRRWGGVCSTHSVFYKQRTECEYKVGGKSKWQDRFLFTVVYVHENHSRYWQAVFFSSHFFSFLFLCCYSLVHDLIISLIHFIQWHNELNILFCYKYNVKVFK